MPSLSELFRALLRRALGGRTMGASLLAALAAGAAAGWLSARYLGAGLGATPSRGIVAWLLVHYDAAALYGLGALAALQVTTSYADDLRAGWPIQYLAAGGTRDRYALALAGAHTAGAGLFYLLTVSTWLLTATAFGRPVSWLPATALRLPFGLLWLFTPTAFAVAALALTARSGRAVATMLGVLLLPWLLLGARQPALELGAPRWLPWALLPSPPYPLLPNIRTIWLLLGYSAIALAIAYAAAPRRLVRL